MNEEMISDEEMSKLLGEQQPLNEPAPMPNMAKLSDEQMDLIHKQNPVGQTVNEMHPGFDTEDRLVVKNLLDTNPKAAYRFLKQKYPDSEIKVSPNGQILRKDPNEANYRPLDPSGFPSSIGEAARDVGDVALDIPVGIAQGAAATAAGSAAAAPTGGFGTLPAAMAASSGVGAGAEALKQQIAKALGYAEETNPEAVMGAAKTGALAPLVFGSGVTAKSISKFTPELQQKALQILEKSGRSVTGRVYDAIGEKMAPAAFNIASGVPKGAIEGYKKNADVIKELDQRGLKDYVTKTHTDFVKAFKEEKQKLGQTINDAITKSGGELETAQIRKPLDDAIAKAEAAAAELGNEESQNAVEGLKYLRDKLFTRPVKDEAGNVTRAPIAEKLSPKAAWNLQDQLRNYSDYTKVQRDLQSSLPGKTMDDKALAATVRDAYSKVNDELNRVSGGLTGKAKEDYAKWMKLEQKIGTNFSSPEATLKTLGSLDTKGKRLLNEELGPLGDKLGLDLRKQAEVINAYNYFGKSPELSAMSGGTTSTSRTVPLSLLLGSLGAYIGYKSGGGMGGTIGGFTGAKLGQTLGSPAAVKGYLNVGKGIDRAVSPVRKGGSEVLRRSPWTLMGNKRKEGEE